MKNKSILNKQAASAIAIGAALLLPFASGQAVAAGLPSQAAPAQGKMAGPQNTAGYGVQQAGAKSGALTPVSAAGKMSGKKKKHNQ